MASEFLSIPEECLSEVASIIRTGLNLAYAVTPRTREALTAWCDEIEEYIKEFGRDSVVHYAPYGGSRPDCGVAEARIVLLTWR